MAKIKFIFFLFTAFISNAQTVISFSNSQAEFSGGKNEWRDIVVKNGHIPDSVKNGLISGGVYIILKIDTNGNATIQDVHSRCSECKQEAIRLFKLLPKFKPAIQDNKKIVSTYNLPVRFKADPDSLIIYKEEYLYGTWLMQSKSKIKCSDCPSILFNKDKTAILIGDTLNWKLNNRELVLKNRNNPKRQMYFLNATDYKITFSDYFKEAIIENSKEKYHLYKQ